MLSFRPRSTLVKLQEETVNTAAHAKTNENTSIETKYDKEA